jgi:hypothetical protein
MKRCKFAKEGSTEDCAAAIGVSLKKIGNIKLQGQSTDSGGGGVLDGLAKKLDELFLCRPNYLIASCSLHCLQLAIANPIKTTIGEGGLDKKNAMQLIHSVYDLQDSMDRSIWKTHCEAAMTFLNANLETAYVGITQADNIFATKWEKIKTFRKFELIDADTFNKTVMKVQAPVLTRWWTVGDAATMVWNAYLLIFRVCQQVINSQATVQRSNKIASGLQPLLLEEEIFSDVALIHNYHCFFVTPHFGWMQSEDDLTNLPGFQSHNMLARYYLLVRDLGDLKTKLLTTHPSFHDTRLSLLNLQEAVAIKQRKKIATFIDIALEAIEKHFVRWCNKSLLPAALLSAKELAIPVAFIMTARGWDGPVDAEDFYSQVHKSTFSQKKYFEFIRDRQEPVDNGTQYEPFAVRAANLLLGGSEFRNKFHPYPMKHFMYEAYLPLASHTQFVEAGVKEAKIISCTDRSEQLRSAYAVNRSANIHNDRLSSLTVPERIQWILRAAEEHVTRQEVLAEEEGYVASVSAIAKLMRQEHFKQDRVQQLQDDTLNKLNKNKADNALQQRTGVDRTHATEGLFAYGKIVKKLHLDAIRIELVFRGCAQEEVNTWTITVCKTKLKELEIKRVEDDNDADTANKEASHKAFKPLSGAVFPAS